MGLFGSLFGSSGGYSGDYKRQGKDLFGRYDQAALAAYGEPAFQTQMSGYTEGLDNSLANQRAAGYGGLLTRGFQPSSPDLYGLTRATNLARHGVNTRQNMRTGYMGALQNLFGMHQGLGQENYKAPTQGIIGQVAQAAGQYYGMQAGGGAGGLASAASVPLPYQMPPPAVNWWNQPGLPYR